MNDLALIQELQQQNEEAMQQFLRRYTPLLRYIIVPILPRKEDQEECLSEITLRILEKIGQYDPQKGSFTAWLTAIARHAALNRLRAAKEPAGELTEEIPSPEPTPEQALLRKERQQALIGALKQLRPAEQQLFFRKYYYFQSTAQIAAELGLTPRAVEGRLYRIKKQLQKRLGGDILEES